jgi:TIR domain
VPDDVYGGDYTGEGSPFFLSYARADESGLADPRPASPRPGRNNGRDPDHYVVDFFHDLSENVSQLIPLRVGVAPGFMDQEMSGGVIWDDALIRELGTCQILVALLSVRYLQSNWCGKEWHAFKLRQVWPRQGRRQIPQQRNIIPVIWAPLADGLPAQISRELIFTPKRSPDPDVPIQYRENGIYGMLKMKQHDYCGVVTWQLAMHIRDVYLSQRAERREFKDGELLNFFERGDRDGEERGD